MIGRMAALDQFFDGPPSKLVRPEIRRLEAQFRIARAESYTCEFHRVRDGLAYGPATLLVFFEKARTEVAPEHFPWDLEIDEWLVDHGARASNQVNESERFGFSLRERIAPIEDRYGSGYLSSVLVQYLHRSEIAVHATRVKKILARVHEHTPSEGPSAEDCRAQIRQVLTKCAQDLGKSLKYERRAALEIFDGAIAYFLDERFNVTTRELLGF
jgi:hypothetical protein